MSKRLSKFSFFILVITAACPVFAQKTDSVQKTYSNASVATTFPTKPLYVVDDKIIDDTLHDAVNKIDPHKILSIDTVKDDITIMAIYGLRGKMGVIVITTKEYAIKKCQENFSTLSNNYRKYLLQHNNRDDSVAYLFNGVLYDDLDEMILKLYKIERKAIKTLDMVENPWRNGNKNKWIAAITTN